MNQSSYVVICTADILTSTLGNHACISCAVHIVHTVSFHLSPCGIASLIGAKTITFSI